MFIISFLFLSQGPVQFPSNDDDTLQELPHPYEGVSLKARNNDKRRSQQYDDVIY